MEKLRAVAAVRRAEVWMGVGVILGLLFVFSLSGCGGVVCGTGTVEKDGECVAGKTGVECGPGFKIQGDECIPVDEWIKYYCDSETAEVKDGICTGTKVITKGLDPCPACPAVSGSKVCLSGRAIHATSLLAYWSGAIEELKDVTFVPDDDTAIVKVYDPIAFVSNPTGSLPLNTGPITKDGCFLVKDVTIPFSGFFALAVDDKSKTGTTWAFVAAGETPEPGKNSENLEIPAMLEKDLSLWGKELYTTGTMIMVFRDKLTGKAVAGVTPTLEGQALTGSDHKFFADDPSKSPYFDDKAATTTKSGALYVKKAPVKSFSGKKGSCSVESGLGGSSPGTFFFRFFDVESC